MGTLESDDRESEIFRRVIRDKISLALEELYESKFSVIDDSGDPCLFRQANIPRTNRAE